MTGESRRLLLAVSMLFVISSPALAQVFKQDADLVATDGSTQKVASIKAGTAAEVLERKGFWVRVKSSGQVGWVKVTSLQFGASAGGKVALDTGRLSKGNIVASSAARGMSRGEFLDAEPDERQLVGMLAFAPSSDEVQQFRTAGGLVDRKVSPLSVPPPAAAQGQAAQGGGDRPSSKAPKPKEKSDDDW